MNKLKPNGWLLVMLVTFLPNPLISQEINITASEYNFDRGSTTIKKIFGHDAENYFVISHHSGQYYIEKLDRNLNSVIEAPLKLYEGLKTYDMETVVHFHGELIVIVSRRKINETVLYYQKIDKATLLPSTDLIELTTIKFVKGNWPDFHFALSKHETKLMIVSRIKLNWTKVQYNELMVYDGGMELVWKREDLFTFEGQGPRENIYLVDDLSNISILSLLKRESITSLFQDVKNAYTIYRYTRQGKIVKEYPISLENRYIRGVRIIADDRGELICAGLYSELFRAGVGGTFFFRIDAGDGILYDNQSHAFSDDLLIRLANTKEPIMAEEELMKYVLTDLVLRDNGNIILIAEQLFEQTYNTYNNLIITCFDTTGQVNWSQVVPKRQDFDVRYLLQHQYEVADFRDYIRETGSVNEYIENFCSYALIAPIDGNDITLIYNDHIRNIEPGEKPKNFIHPRKSYIAAVHIDAFGTLTKYDVLHWKRKSLYPEPIRYYDTLGKTVIIPAYKGRKYNYYKITASY
jgi:hypothetical protein